MKQTEHFLFLYHVNLIANFDSASEFCKDFVYYIPFFFLYFTFYFFSIFCYPIIFDNRDKIFKNGLSKICGRQLLKIFK